jgi:nucleoside-diphosphate-sugar epimerase
MSDDGSPAGAALRCGGTVQPDSARIMTAAPPLLFCFGLGYCGLALARSLQASGWRVAGTCRSVETQATLASLGIAAQLFDRARPLPDPQAAFGAAAAILSAVPPDESGDPVLDCHGADLARVRDVRWVGYLSTTGVYGDRQGGWVDEGSALRPTGVRGRRRVAAEQGWMALHRAAGLPVHVFRLAGIYGPGRNALRSLCDGAARRVVKPGQVFSRIHRDDIVAVLRASLARPNPGAVYNVCDDDPAAPDEVVAHAAALLGVSPPPAIGLAEAGLSPMARSFFDDNKRVANRRIKEELGVALRYPDYRSGLAALLAAGEGRGSAGA